MGEEKFLSLGSPLTGREVGQDGGELQSLRGECSSRSRGKAAPAQCGRAACPSLSPEDFPDPSMEAASPVFLRYR